MIDIFAVTDNRAVFQINFSKKFWHDSRDSSDFVLDHRCHIFMSVIWFKTHSYSSKIFVIEHLKIQNLQFIAN